MGQGSTVAGRRADRSHRQLDRPPARSRASRHSATNQPTSARLASPRSGRPYGAIWKSPPIWRTSSRPSAPDTIRHDHASRQRAHLAHRMSRAGVLRLRGGQSNSSYRTVPCFSFPIRAKHPRLGTRTLRHCTFFAHERQKRPASMRTDEISAAGQGTCGGGRPSNAFEAVAAGGRRRDP